MGAADPAAVRHVLTLTRASWTGALRSDAVRVVAGTARGRKLVAPDGSDVRPTLDRVREAVFNSLGSLDAVHGAVVLDLFAGTGALGIEALSRGAERAVFVDAAAASLAAVRANLDATGLDDRARVVSSDAFAYLADAPDQASGDRFDLVLADPPYEFDRWGDLVRALRPLVAPGAVVVAESDRPVADDVEAAVEAAGGAILRERHHGGTVVTMFDLDVDPGSPR